MSRARGSQMTSHTSIIGHGRRKRGGFRWEQHGAPLDAFSRLACQSELELAACNHGRYFVVLLFGSAPNLDPIAFKEAALARLRNVAVSFESGASRSTLAVALAVCLSSFRMK